MKDWNFEAYEQDKFLLQVLSILFERNKNLLYLLLDSNAPRLSTSPEIIKEISMSLSSGEDLLIRIGLDIWDGGTGGIHFNELYQKLDGRNFKNILFILQYLYNNKIP